MRRKRKRNYKLPLLILLLIISSLSMSYALLSTSINIRGTVRGNNSNGYIVDQDSNPNLKPGDESKNSWKEGENYKYQITFPVQNIGNMTFDNYKITITFDTEILSVTIWNFDYEINGRDLIVKSSNNLAPNQSVQVNFIVTVKKDSLNIKKIKLETDTTENVIDNSLFLVNFTRGSGWGNYTYQYTVTVQNKTGKQITYWQISVELPEGTTFQSGWSAIFGTNNNILVIKNESYNGKLNPNQGTSFGLQLNTNKQNFIPDKYTVVVR